MEEKLRAFLAPYVGQGTEKRDIITQEAVDLLVIVALEDHIEQEIIDYGTSHPEAPFWDFLNLVKPGLGEGITQEDLLVEDDDS